jgi:predicted nucleic acid-binding protein
MIGLDGDRPDDPGRHVRSDRTARRAGLTVRSSVDCLIAAAALRNDLEVLHRDRDFDALSRVSGLRVRKVRR